MTGRTPRILVVEDTESTRYLQTTWLRRAGYEVVEAATGAEALRLVDDDIDVVVLDVHLPDMSGFDVCSAIKASGDTATVPVMHVSATAVDVHSRAEGLERGADAYLVEPVDRAEYLAIVGSLARVRAARRAAARMAEQLTRLVAAALPVNAADSLVRLLEATAEGAADVFGTPALAVAETGTGRAVRALSAGREVASISESAGLPLTLEWRGNPIYLAEGELPTVWDGLLARARVGPSRWFVWPLHDEEGSVSAGLAIALPPGSGTLPAQEEQILGRLVDTVGVALRNMRVLTRERRTALTLQRALLPERLPDVPGLSFAGRYHASSDVASVGGDFYDAFVLPAGGVVVVVGDVQGHSLQAAVVMAELRFSLRAFMIEHRAPADVVRLLNTLLMTYHPDVTATLVLLVVSPDHGSLEIVNAGHLPPLLVAGDSARYLEQHGVLLGVPGPLQESAHFPFPPGASLVLVTDGLLERRGESLDTGLDRLREAALRPGYTDPDCLADLLVERFDVGVAEDDVAVVVVRRD